LNICCRGFNLGHYTFLVRRSHFRLCHASWTSSHSIEETCWSQGYVVKQGKRALATLRHEAGPIHALTYSSGAGQYILSGSSDRTINLYNPAKASPLIQSYTGAHGYEVLSISVADDNARFVSGGGDKTVFLWDVATARTLRRYTGHAGRVECVAFGGEGDAVLVSGSFDGTVRLWDTKGSSGKPLMVLGEARDGVQCVAVTGGEIVAGSVDGRLRTYDLRMGMVHVDVIGRELHRGVLCAGRACA